MCERNVPLRKGDLLTLSCMQPIGKTALVTGGNDGLGFAICLGLAKKNAHVFLTARNPEKGKEYVLLTTVHPPTHRNILFKMSC